MSSTGQDPVQENYYHLDVTPCSLVEFIDVVDEISVSLVMVDDQIARRTPLYTEYFRCPDQPSSGRAWIHTTGKGEKSHNGIMSLKTVDE
jgi:hypothetical protein